MGTRRRMSNEIVLSESALSIEQVVKQRELIKSAMKNAMQDGVHYGKIPGCGDKPSLMQSGAQLLCFLFKVRPEYEVNEVDFPGEHREYRILCKLYHTASGMEVGQGVGICSTRETKYRFRNEAKEVTWLQEPVPHVYWNLRKKPDDLKRWMQTVFGDRDLSNIGTKKNDAGQWFFVEYHGGEGKMENPNIADVFNTVIKIAKKRAFVDASITVTASNDLFTQDLEDRLDAVEPVTKDTIAAKEKEAEKTPGEGTTTAAATTEKKPEEKAKKAKPVPKDGSAGWRTVRVHFGTPGGKIHNRELGTMARSTLDWLNEQMAKKSAPSKLDEVLMAALAEEKAEREATPKKEGHGPLLEMLHAKCQALKISLAAITAVNRDLGGKAELFIQIPEEEAKYLLEHWDSGTGQACIDKMDNIPMT